jgi:hypothetical protein
MRMIQKIAAMSVAPSLILGGYTLGRVSDNMPEASPTAVVQAVKCGPEDGPRWNAARCGNRTMGVYVDVTPNNGKRDGEWLNLTFKKGHDDRGTFKPRKR